MKKALIFGKGAIYNLFYEELLLLGRFNVDFYDPRLNLFEIAEKGHYDLIIISSPPQHHIQNFRILQEGSIGFDCLIVEKPAVISESEFLELRSLGFDLSKVFTVTPFRNLNTWNVLRDVRGSIRSIRIRYGVMSKWQINSQSHEMYNSVLFDFGPHVLDSVISALCLSTFKILNCVSSFNRFNCAIDSDGIRLNLDIARDEYLENDIVIELYSGERVVMSYPTGNFAHFVKDNSNFRKSLSRNSLDVYSELMGLMNGGRHSCLFSPVVEFELVVKLLNKCL